jgi:hypothetical protein
MAVIGTPLTVRVPPFGDGASPRPPGEDASPRTSSVFGRPVPSRLKSVVVPDGQKPSVRWQVVDLAGCPVELDRYKVGDVVPVVLRVVEATRVGEDPEFPGYAADPAAGLVDFKLDTGVLGPGIFTAEVIVLDADTVTPVLTNALVLVVEPSLGGHAQPSGVPTLAQVRLRMRDSPQDNELLGDFAWDGAEFAAALQDAVDFWNAALPDTGVYRTTSTWPPQHRYWLIRGTMAGMYRIAAAWHRQNQLDYQAGGETVQDTSKAPLYDQAADAIWAEYKAWVQSSKIRDNQEQMWGSVGGYPR